MNCREFIDFLVDYFDGQLPDCQGAVFQEHLQECPECHDYLTMYQDTLKLTRCSCINLDTPLPDEVPEELIQAILASRPSSAE